jgi:hypothetical protein
VTFKYLLISPKANTAADPSWVYANRLWDEFFKTRVDDLPHKRWSEVQDTLLQWFTEAAWYGVYDFLEFSAAAFPDSDTLFKGDDGRWQSFMTVCNEVLESEMAGYRFVGKHIAPVTNEIELESLDAALECPTIGVASHLDTALTKLSDRQKPDYRNSIKESISAVEAACRILTGAATLGDALNELGRRHNLSPLLKSAWQKLYAYTNGSDGIRHALMDEAETVAFHEAKFMLVACSSFMNYITATYGTMPMVVP